MLREVKRRKKEEAVESLVHVLLQTGERIERKDDGSLVIGNWYQISPIQFALKWTKYDPDISEEALKRAHIVLRAGDLIFKDMI